MDERPIAPPDPSAAAYFYDPYPDHDEPRTILGLTAKEDAAAAIFSLILIGIIAIGFCIYMATRQPKPCDAPQSFSCIDQRVQECMASDKYSKEQCVILVGGNK